MIGSLAKPGAFVLAILVGIALLAHIQPAVAFQSDPFALARSESGSGKAKQSGIVKAVDLPPAARDTLKLIKQGGPFPYPKDGTIFGNREGRLPPRPRGYYKEYTVKTPGDRSRGALRIVAGTSGEFYYTDDHYNTFKLIEE